MTILTIDVPSGVYERLRAIAEQQGKPIEIVAREWLAEKSAVAEPVVSEREQLRAALRAVGKLTELSQEEKQLAAQSTLTLDEARAILDRSSGKPLSELIL